MLIPENGRINPSTATSFKVVLNRQIANVTLADHAFRAVIHRSNVSARQYSTDNNKTRSLSHVDASGKAKMVDVGEKNITKRVAEARGVVIVGAEVSKQISENNMKKGDVLVVAQLAGIMAAKRTSDLIPLCHPLNLSYINVNLRLDPVLHRVEIISEVRCTGKTGVEMEALTAVSVAALTVYDMCKALAPPNILQITGIEVITKTGGKSGNFFRGEINDTT